MDPYVRNPRRVPTARRAHPDGVIDRQQSIRCGKPGCRRCPPDGPGHGPDWYGFDWGDRQRTRSFYVGKRLPAGIEPISDADPATSAEEVIP